MRPHWLFLSWSPLNSLHPGYIIIIGTLFFFYLLVFLIDYNTGLFPDATAPYPTREMTLHMHVLIITISEKEKHTTVGFYSYIGGLFNSHKVVFSAYCQLISRIKCKYCLINISFDRVIWHSRILVTFYKWGHFLMLIIRNLNLISVQSWTYLQLPARTF